jgi:flagellar motor switch protein FliG
MAVSVYTDAMGEENAKRAAAAYGKAMRKRNDAADEAAAADESTVEAAVGRNPPGFIKTGTPVTGQSVQPAQPSTDSKYRRVAKFLILIGSERAAEILSQLEPQQVEAISKEITTVKTIDALEGAAVLEEFKNLLSAPYGFSGGASGGVEAARRLLYAAYGPEKGEEVLLRSVPEAKANPFDFLEDFSGEQLALLFKEEPPAAAALVFSRLPPKLSAAALAGITGEKKLEIVRRIAKPAAVAPEVLERVAGALKEKARHITDAANRSGGEAEFDGMGTLAAILKSADASFGDHLLNELEIADPELGKNLKDKIYSLDDIVHASDLPLQKKLAAMEDRDIALLLKGRPIEFREKILSNLSAARRSDVFEEGEIAGPVPRSEVDEVANEFLLWFRSAREDGSLLMLNDEDVVV